MSDPIDISKGFILNKAVHDATNILLKPYMPVTLSDSPPNNYEDKYETVDRIKKYRWVSHSQDFFLKMSTIAWDFLNVLNVYQNNLADQSIEDTIDSPIL